MTAQLYTETLNLMERYGKCIITEDSNVEFENFKEYVKLFSQNKEKDQFHEIVLGEILNALENSSDKEKSEEFLRSYHDRIAEYSNKVSDIENCETYQEFMSSIGYEQSEDGDSDEDDDPDAEILTVSENLNTIDPISKLRIVDPVRNIKCGHYYERSTMLQLIAKRPNTRCPIVGCAAKTYVKISELVFDEKLKKQLSKIK